MSIFARTIALAVAALTIGASPALAACTTTYVGPVDGDWATAAHWSTNAAPTATDDVCIPADMGTVHVADTEVAAARSFVLDSPLQVDPTGTLNLGSPSTLVSGTLVVGGLVNGNLTMRAGVLTTLGIGVIRGNVDEQGGTITPGGDGAIGTLFVYQLTEGVHATIDIDLASPTDFDRMNDLWTLNGTVRVHLIGGYVPPAGTSWVLSNNEGAWPAAHTTFQPATYVRRADPSNGFVLELAPAATLTAPRRVVVDRVGDPIAAVCGLSAGAVARCTVTARASDHTILGQGTANGPTVTVAVNAAGLRRAGTGAGVVATLTAAVVSADAGAYSATARTSVTLVRKKAVLRVVSDILFAFNSATLSTAGIAEMNRIGAQLVGAKSLRCDGHTDNVGSASYNRALGLARAKAVCRVLGRYVPHVTSKSFGESKPVASNKTASGRARNRRVEIQIFN